MKNSVSQELLDEISSANHQALLTGKDKKGTPYIKHIFDIHFKLFGEVCSNCPGKIAGYINRIKNYNSKATMKNQEKNTNTFQLNEGVIIPVPGTSKAYSNHNLTDDIALELLAVNPNRRTLFRTLPADVDKQIEAFLQESKKDANQAGTASSDELLVVVGNHNISVEEAISLLEKINVSTKATTVKGVEKKISELNPVEAKEFNALVEGLISHKISAVNTDANQAGSLNPNPNAKNVEQLQFDLDKATQDYEGIEADGPEKEAAKQILEAAKLALKEATGTN